MRLVPLAEAAGLELARDVPSPRAGAPALLRGGAVLRDAYVRALADAGVRTAWVHDELGEGIDPEPAVADEVRAEAERAVAAALSDAEAAVAAGRPLAGAAVAGVVAAAELLLASLAEEPRRLGLLHERTAPEAHPHRHAVGTAVAGLLVGRAHMRREGWTDWRTGRRTRGEGIDDRLGRLATGLLLQDVGMAAVPAGVVRRAGPLDDAERTLVRRHPETGIALLAGSGLPPAALAVVAGHHERFDGTGYPAGTTGAAIPVLAQVAAVADVFHAVGSDRPYAPAASPAVAAEAIRAGAGTQFDPDVAATAADVLLPFPLGSTVALPDGRVAAVAAVDADDPQVVTVRVRGADGRVGEEVVAPARDATVVSPAGAGR